MFFKETEEQRLPGEQLTQRKPPSKNIGIPSITHSKSFGLNKNVKVL